MAHQIVKYALGNNLSISHLEDRSSFKQMLFDLKNLSLHRKETYSEQSLAFRKIHQLHIQYEFLEAIQRGNYEELALLSQNFYSEEKFERVITQRNQRWLFSSPQVSATEGLVHRIGKTSVPLAIAVGAGHLPSEKGLVHLLSQQGFKVERDLS